MLAKKTKYAIHALVRLAKEYDKGPILINDISQREKIPKKFLEAILLDLKNAGFLNSKKGKGGGYYLIKHPDDVNLADVIRLFEGALALLPCVTHKFYERCEECEDETTCGIRQVVHEVKEATVNALKANTLSDILTKEAELKNLKR
jgi:Rrf2 family protein